MYPNLALRFGGDVGKNGGIKYEILTGSDGSMGAPFVVPFQLASRLLSAIETSCGLLLHPDSSSEESKRSSYLRFDGDTGVLGEATEDNSDLKNALSFLTNVYN